MPHQESNLVAPGVTTQERPKESALGFINELMTISVLPPGAVLAFIDPKFAEADGYLLMALHRIDRHGMKLKCPCQDKKCTRTMTAQFSFKGTHPKQGNGE